MKYQLRCLAGVIFQADSYDAIMTFAEHANLTGAEVWCDGEFLEDV